MATLDFEVAKELASSLCTIGHPFSHAVINGTAYDLMRWCDRPRKLDGKIWTPEQQATWLVNEARERWEEGWPERGGTKRLHELFLTKFAPTKPANGAIDWMNEPCVCGGPKKFRDCCYGKPAAEPVTWQPRHGLRPRITEAQLRESLFEADRRKPAQLHRAGME